MPVKVDLGHGRSTVLRLEGLTDLSPTGGRGEAFNLSFSGGAAVRREQTYLLSSSLHGRFPMFLSAAGADGIVRATINRSTGSR